MSTESGKTATKNLVRNVSIAILAVAGSAAVGSMLLIPDPPEDDSNGFSRYSCEGLRDARAIMLSTPMITTPSLANPTSYYLGAQVNLMNLEEWYTYKGC